MLRHWQNEAGVTLIELLAAVVVLGLIVLPFTNLGTTFSAWNEADQLTDQATAWAQELLTTAKREVEQTHALSAAMQQLYNRGRLTARVTGNVHRQLDGTAIPQLIDLRVIITGPDLQGGAQPTVYADLQTTARWRMTTP